MKFYCFTLVALCRTIKDFNCIQGSWKVVSDSKSKFLDARVHIENNAIYINKVFTSPLPYEQRIQLQNVDNYTQVNGTLQSQILVDDHRTLTDFIGVPVAINTWIKATSYDFNATRDKDNTLSVFMKSTRCSEPREIKLQPVRNTATNEQRVLSPTQFLVYLVVVHSIDRVVDNVVAHAVTIAQTVVSTCK